MLAIYRELRTAVGRSSMAMCRWCQINDGSGGGFLVGWAGFYLILIAGAWLMDEPAPTVRFIGLYGYLLGFLWILI